MIFSTRRNNRVVAIILAVACLTGCTVPTEPAHMTVKPEASANKFPEALSHAMCVRTVTGGTKTDPKYSSQVSDEDLHSALAMSLDAAGLTAPGGMCKYPLDVNVLGVMQPERGFSMEVTSHLNYKVYDAAGKPVMLETVTATYTAKAFDAYMGITRLKLATEGSIRNSISQFLEKLRTVELAPTEGIVTPVPAPGSVSSSGR